MRGDRRPTAVYIQRHKDAQGRWCYRLRWIHPVTRKWQGEAAGYDAAYVRMRRSQLMAGLRMSRLGEPESRPLSDVLKAIPVWMAGRAPSTVRHAQVSVRTMSSLLGDISILRVDRTAIMEFRAKRLQSVSGATVNKDLRQIRSVLSYAVDAGWLTANPLLRWKAGPVREARKAVRTITHKEFERLIKACPNPTFRVLLIVAFCQGLRRVELANLRWGDIDGQTMRVSQRPELGEWTKSRKDRAIPLHPDAAKALASMRRTRKPKPTDYVFRWENGARFKPDWITHEFERVRARAGVECTLHDLRRTWSTRLQDAGVDRATVKDLGGWSTIGVVERHYTGDMASTHRTAMSALARHDSFAGRVPKRKAAHK